MNTEEIKQEMVERAVSILEDKTTEFLDADTCMRQLAGDRINRKRRKKKDKH